MCFVAPARALSSPIRRCLRSSSMMRRSLSTCAATSFQRRSDHADAYVPGPDAARQSAVRLIGHHHRSTGARGQPLAPRPSRRLAGCRSPVTRTLDYPKRLLVPLTPCHYSPGRGERKSWFLWYGPPTHARLPLRSRSPNNSPCIAMTCADSFRSEGDGGEQPWP